MKMKLGRHTAAAIAAIFATAQIAYAEPQGKSGTVTRTIAHADLDLKSEKGKRLLQTRLHNLVNELCANDNLTTASVRKHCREAVLKAAIPQVQKAVLQAEAKR
jgi:UrcA family protein